MIARMVVSLTACANQIGLLCIEIHKIFDHAA